MAIRAYWKGNPADLTEHHYGIPARNLTDEEWAELDPDQRDTVRGSKLYRYVTQSRRTRSSNEPDDAAGDQPDDTPTETPEDFAAVAAEEGMGS